MHESQIATLLTKLAVYFDKQLKPEQLKMFCRDLIDLPIEAIEHAILLYCRTPGNVRFPFPNQLRGLLVPNDDQQARDAVSRIVQALHSFPGGDSHNQQRAQAHIGELGWLVVQRMGGWERMGRMSYDEIGPTAQAQWRELAISLLTKKKIGLLDEAPSLDTKMAKIQSHGFSVLNGEMLKGLVGK